MTATVVIETETHRFPPRGGVPNHPRLPLLIYRGVIEANRRTAAAVRARSAPHGWHGFWTNGVYRFHHFHVDAHEALAIISGHALVTFGGPGGADIALGGGDAVVIPAGVGHCAVAATPDFACVGFYPIGQDADLSRDDSPPSDGTSRIDRVPLPPSDPFFGRGGSLDREWGIVSIR